MARSPWALHVSLTGIARARSACRLRTRSRRGARSGRPPARIRARSQARERRAHDAPAPRTQPMRPPARRRPPRGPPARRWHAGAGRDRRRDPDADQLASAAVLLEPQSQPGRAEQAAARVQVPAREGAGREHRHTVLGAGRARGRRAGPPPSATARSRSGWCAATASRRARVTSSPRRRPCAAAQTGERLDGVQERRQRPHRQAAPARQLLVHERRRGAAARAPGSSETSAATPAAARPRAAAPPDARTDSAASASTTACHAGTRASGRRESRPGGP